MNVVSPSRRGVSGVLSMILITLMIIAFLVGFAYVSEQSRRTQLVLEERYRLLAESTEMSRSISAIWNYNRDSRLLEINITNNYNEPVNLLGIVLINEKGSYEIVDQKLMVAPGETLNIALVYENKPSIIYLGLSGARNIASSVLVNEMMAIKTDAQAFWRGYLLDEIYSGYIKVASDHLEISNQSFMAGNLISGYSTTGFNLSSSELEKITLRDKELFEKEIGQGNIVFSLVLRGTLDISRCITNQTGFTLDVKAKLNSTGQINYFNVSLFSFNTDRYETIKTSNISNKKEAILDFQETVKKDYVGTNNSFFINFTGSATGQSVISIDVANLYADCYSVIYSGYSFLVGDSQEIVIYRLVDGVIRDRVLSISYPVKANLGIDATYSLINNKLLFVVSNISNVRVFGLDLHNLTKGWIEFSACEGLGYGPNLIAEPFINGSYKYLLIASGDKYCIVNIDNSTSTSSLRLPGIVVGMNDGFVSSASDLMSVYIAGVNATSSKPHIFVFSGQDRVWSSLGESPTLRPVGMAINRGIIWLIGDTGSLYLIDTKSRQVSIYGAMPSFIPRENGDKLEAKDSYLIFVRGDFTSEYWVLEIK